MRESDLERKLCDFAKRLGLLCFKNVCPGRRGVPDRKFVRPGGQHLYMEVKAKGKKPTPLQIKEIARFREYGVAATWVDDLIAGKSILQRFYSTNTHPA